MADAQELIDTTPSERYRPTKEDRIQSYRQQKGYGGELVSRYRNFRNKPIVKKLIGSKSYTYKEGKKTIRVPPRGVYRTMTARMPIPKRRMPGPSMIRQESASKIAGFISGRQIYTGSKGYARPGRPKGSFYKYTIPGVGPVDVFTWRKYQRNQQRLLAMKMMQQSPTMSYPEARQAIKQVQPSQYQQQPQIIQLQAQEQQIQPNQIPITPNFQPSYQPQDDGWNLLRVRSPLTLGTGAPRPIQPVTGINTPQPVGNKFTSYYSEPNFLSGQQTMKRRPDIGGFGLW